MRILAFVCFAIALAGLADAQPFLCQGQVAVTPITRGNGRAETVGDALLVCTGTPPSGGAVNVSVFLNTFATSRSFNPASPANEALLLVDEPGSGIPGTPPTQIPCGYTDETTFTCPAGTNTYQGSYSAANQINFFGVTIPPPLAIGGPSLIFRITNLRADVTALPPFGNVMASISISGPVSVPINNPTFAVAFVGPAPMTSTLLMPDLVTPVPAAGIPLSQCVAVNRLLSLDPTSPTAPEGVGFVVRLKENFSTAFMNYSVPAFVPADVNSRPPAAAQNVPGTIYNKETAFFNPVFPATDNLVLSGLATQGTRILLKFVGPPAGVQIHAPVYENGGTSLNSRLRLVATAPDGSSPSYTPLGPLSPLNTYYSTAQVYVYEVTARTPVNPVGIDTIDLPFYFANPGAPYVGLGLTQVNVTLAPTSADHSPTNILAPRFADVSIPMPVANLGACAGVPMLKALILSKAGAIGGNRTWQIGLNNFGTAPATTSRVTGLTLFQTAGPVCAPVVTTPFPVPVGFVGIGATVPGAVNINFAGCAATARFKVTIDFAADLGISGNNVYFNQFQ